MAATLCPTLLCDQRCVMCPNKMGTDMGHLPTAEKCIRLADSLDANETHVTVSGGEPTLLGSSLPVLLFQIQRQCPDCRIQLLSHGGRFADPEYSRSHASMRDRMHVEVPLHAHQAKLHDQITQVHGSFLNASRAIRNLILEGFAVDVRVVVTRLNYEHLVNIVGYVLNTLPGVRSLIFISMEATGNCRNNLATLWIDHKAVLPHIESAVFLALEAGSHALLYNYALCLLSRQLWSLAADSISPSKKAFADCCEGCLVKCHCPGMFMSNVEILDNELYPIISI
jgi:His-Xaa-Ser system radical SAM maturase HxsC